MTGRESVVAGAADLAEIAGLIIKALQLGAYHAFRPDFPRWEKLIGLSAPNAKFRSEMAFAAARLICLAKCEVNAPSRTLRNELSKQRRLAGRDFTQREQTAEGLSGEPALREQVRASADAAFARWWRLQRQIDALPALAGSRPPLKGMKVFILDVASAYREATGRQADDLNQRLRP